MERIKR